MNKTLNIEIAKTNEEQQTASGLVYAPMIRDSQGDFMTAPAIKEAQQRFMKSGRMAAIDIDHDGKFVDAFVCESAISKGEDFPKGSWTVTVKIEDADVWKQVRKGKLTGFSMMGSGQRTVSKLNGKTAHMLHNVEIDSISLVRRAANMETFSVVKNDNPIQALTEQLTAIGQALQKTTDALGKIEKRQADLDQKIGALPDSIPAGPSFFRKAQPVNKAAVHPNQEKVRHQLAKRQRVQKKFEKVMERPDLYLESENELLRKMEAIEDELAALGYSNDVTLDDPKHSAFFQTGGSSNFLQASSSTVDEILGVRARRGNRVAKSDELTEEDIPVENCLIL